MTFTLPTAWLFVLLAVPVLVVWVLAMHRLIDRGKRWIITRTAMRTPYTQEQLDEFRARAHDSWAEMFGPSSP